MNFDFTRVFTNVLASVSSNVYFIDIFIVKIIRNITLLYSIDKRLMYNL